MTDADINRVVQYVTASTSYGRDTVDRIVRVGMAEVAALATTRTCRHDREALLEYVCRWTMKRTGEPEPLVREVLGHAGRWLDEMCRALLGEDAETSRTPDA